ncbi:MAG: OmpA family protein [Aureispira sp.]|nr:OmpA family protein [Aureispira sp.]
MNTKLLFMAIVLLCPLLNYAQNLQTHIYFESAQHIPSTEQLEQLKQFISKLDLHSSSYKMHLIGRTDTKGSETYNENLAQNRCKALLPHLNKWGIDSNQISIESQPAHKTKENLANGEQRRVDLYVKYISKPLETTVEKITFRAEEGLAYIYERSGTSIYIPPYALVDANGKTVQGKVDLSYQEFRDVADFIATDIPMTFQDKLFHSAGMFDIQAVQKGKPVFVKDEEYINIDFAKTSDTIQDLNFYAYADNKWEELGVVDQVQGFNQFEKRQTCDGKYEPWWPKTMKDSLWSFLSGMKVGHLATKHNIGIFKRKGFQTLEEQWADLDYKYKDYTALIELGQSVQLTKMRTAKTRKYGICFSLNTGKIAKELTTLTEHAWQLHSNQVPKWNNNYMDMRLLYDGQDTISFVLKSFLYQAQYDTFKVSPLVENGDVTQKTALCQSLVQEHRVALQKKAALHNEEMRFMQHHWRYFLAFTQFIIPTNEQCLNVPQWIQFFSKNKALMEARYSPFNDLEYKKISMDSLYRLAQKAKYINATEQNLEAVLAKEDSIMKAVRSTMLNKNPKKDKLITIPFSQFLRVATFGTFNCDATVDPVIGGTNYKRVLASFQDELGRRISPKEIHVINYKLNGIDKFTNPNIRYPSNRKVALFVIDDDGAHYTLATEEFSKIKKDLHKSPIFTFQLTNVSPQTESAQKLRNFLVAN